MLLTMEDHRDAYFLWQKLGIQNAACLHIDAHLDMAGFLSPLETHLDSPEINCANYLLKAVEHGIVNEVVWVIPPHIAQQNLLHWAYSELPKWLSLDLPEFNSLHLKDHRVEGSLRGARFTLCTTDHLPEKQGPWLFDLDIDYLIDDQDHVWQTPFELHQKTQHLELQATTIAYSVRGGYTPVARRYLGDLAELIWSGQLDQAQHFYSQLHSLHLEENASNKLKAAALVTRAWGLGSDHQGPAWEQAAELDPAYTVSPFDVSALYWQRKKFGHCLKWLPQEQADYIRGFIALEQNQHDKAAQHWEKLLDTKDDIARKHLHSLLAKAYKNHPDKAIAALQNTLPDGDAYREIARLQKQTDKQEAIKNFRKAIKLDPLKLDNLEAQIELAELYIETEQAVRAQAEYRKLSQLDLPGKLGIRTERLPVKIALSQKRR
ncbi:MAG: hypothetical protein J0I12_20850 [Candidatus Eremiobacteraeota bacterium]|nr:hypothetical protein [Candidatus Eremiobacteraeota bacterium]